MVSGFSTFAVNCWLFQIGSFHMRQWSFFNSLQNAFTSFLTLKANLVVPRALTRISLMRNYARRPGPNLNVNFPLSLSFPFLLSFYLPSLSFNDGYSEGTKR